jgi:hypothetical protein
VCSGRVESEPQAASGRSAYPAYGRGRSPPAATVVGPQPCVREFPTNHLGVTVTTPVGALMSAFLCAQVQQAHGDHRAAEADQNGQQVPEAAFEGEGFVGQDRQHNPCDETYDGSCHRPHNQKFTVFSGLLDREHVFV